MARPDPVFDVFGFCRFCAIEGALDAVQGMKAALTRGG